MPLRNFEFPFKTGFDMITTEWYTRATVSKSKDNNGKTIVHVVTTISLTYWDGFSLIWYDDGRDYFMCIVTHSYRKVFFLDLQTFQVYVVCVWWFQWSSRSEPNINVVFFLILFQSHSYVSSVASNFSACNWQFLWLKLCLCISFWSYLLSPEVVWKR